MGLGSGAEAGRIWRTLQKLPGLPWIDCRNMDVKHPTGEYSEVYIMVEKNTNFLRVYLSHWEQIVSRIMDIKIVAGKGSEGN